MRPGFALLVLTVFLIVDVPLTTIINPNGERNTTMTLNKKRRKAIDEALKNVKVITAPAVIAEATLDLVTSGEAEPKWVTNSVYKTLKHYDTIGKLVKVPNTCPQEYTLHDHVEDRKEQKSLLNNLSGDEMAEVFHAWIRNYELKPEAAKKYQRKIAELTEEIKKLKAAHEQALNHAKAEYKKVADKLNSFMALAKS
jgi:DNA-binding transcriptional MerR regulator